jgi:hypothetical protein
MAKNKYAADSDSEEEKEEDNHSVFIDPEVTRIARLINGADRYHAGLPPSLNGVPIVREERTPDWVQAMMDEQEEEKEEKEEDLVISQNPLYTHDSHSSLQTYNGTSDQDVVRVATSVDGIILDTHQGTAVVTGVSSSYCAHHK